jgi:spore coat polysaccharide biosynthesis protein SpsF
MSGSRPNPDALVVVQCRYGSTRLPGKAMLPLAGHPMLGFLLKRLEEGLSGSNMRIVLATTRKPEDDQIEELGLKLGHLVVRGSQDDVLDRYVQVLETVEAPFVIRVTADNPLTCPEMLLAALKEAQVRDLDYFMFNDLPKGTAVDVFSAEILRRMNLCELDAEEREHVNLYILNNPGCCRMEMKPSGLLDDGGVNLTVDTPEEYRFLRSLVEHDCSRPWRITIPEILSRVAAGTLSR